MLHLRHVYKFTILYFTHTYYGCNVWGFTSEENLNKIEILQKKCLRIMTFPDFKAHANPLFEQLKFLEVCDIIKMQQLRLPYEFLSNALPSDLRKLFMLNSEIHDHDVRDQFFVPRINTSTYGNNSVKFHCPDLWNSTFRNGIAINSNHDDIVRSDDIKSINQLKKNLKKHFFYLYSLEDSQ